MDEDEDSRLFLSMLDATAERIFEACAEMVAESSTISVACDTETVHQSTSNRLQQDDESCSQLNTLPSASQESSYRNQSRKRRKRSWTTDQHVLEEPSSATLINLSTNENTCAFVGWPQTFTFSSYEPSKPLQEFKAKNNFTFTKNFKQHQRKGALRTSVNNPLGGAMLPPIAGIDGKCETKNTEKFDDFSKEVHEAIDRIESLIPSLQKLANGVETPINQQNAGKLELRNNSNSNSEDDQVNRLGMANVLEVTKNDVANAGKYAEHSEYIFRGEGDQMFREGIVPISYAVSQNTSRKQNLFANRGVKLSTNLFRGPNEAVNQIVHLPMDRVRSHRRATSRNESVIGYTPEHFQGLRISPCQCSKNICNLKQTREQAAMKDKRLRFQTPVPSVESSSFRRPKKISSIDKSDRKAGKSHSKGKRMLHVRDSIHRTSSRRKSTNGASQSKITLHNQISEETSWTSPSTSSGSVRQSGGPSSLNGSYLSTDLYSGGSDETASGYEKVRQSSRKWSDSSQSDTDYDTFSDYNSQDWCSDISPSGQGSSEWSPTWEDHRVEKGKTVGRIRKLRKKLGTIFHHHHHHHHHHYNDRDESDLGHIGLLKRLGKLFHRSGKNDRKRVKADKPQKPGSKIVVKKKQDVGHFRTLVDGLMRHTKHSKKPKKVKDNTEILGSGRQKSKRTEKKLPWLPKMGRGKVKVPKKGKVKLKRIATKTAKMILT